MSKTRATTRATTGAPVRVPTRTRTTTRTTLTIDEDVLRAVKVRAARLGRSDSAVIEEALRRDLGLDLLDRLWARNDLPEAEAAELGMEARQAARRPKR